MAMPWLSMIVFFSQRLEKDGPFAIWGISLYFISMETEAQTDFTSIPFLICGHK